MSDESAVQIASTIVRNIGDGIICSFGDDMPNAQQAVRNAIEPFVRLIQRIEALEAKVAKLEAASQDNESDMGDI